MAPKHVFCGKNVLEISAYLAACMCNEGYQPVLKCMEIMGITLGPKAVEFAEQNDRTRIRTANHRSSSKEARTSRRKARSAQEDSFDQAEGVLYGAGIAD